MIRAYRINTDGTGGWLTLQDTSEPGTHILPYRDAIRTELGVDYIDPIEFPIRRGRRWAMWVDDEFNFKDLPVNQQADDLLRRFRASLATSWNEWQVHGSVLLTGRTTSARQGWINQVTDADIAGFGFTT